MTERRPECQPESEVERQRRMVAQAFQRVEAPGTPSPVHDTSIGATLPFDRLRALCPRCHEAVDWSSEAKASITCHSCGGTFSLADDRPSFAHAGQRIGPFELLERLGEGAFGVVFKARDERLDRSVAIKLARRESSPAGEVDAFLREARAAAQLKHPHIVGVHEVGRERESVYIISDLIEGGSLAKLLKIRKPSFRESGKLCQTIARALEYAHRAGIIHRDLKPENILIDSAGEPHLTDFGLAKRANNDITITLAGQVVGTPAYMSPEQARGESHMADARSDVYSLGVVLYELLTGELPFRGMLSNLLRQIVEDDPPLPQRLNAHIPKDLETICIKCMEKNPAARYQSAEALADDLQRFDRNEPIQARPVSRAERGWRWCRRNPAIAATLATSCAVLVAVAIVATLTVTAAERSALRREIYTQTSIAQRLVGAPGWRAASQDPLRELARDRARVEDRDLFATTLVGMDAQRVVDDPGAVSSVAFAAEGDQLLIGGSTARATSMRQLSSSDVKAFAKRTHGQVAFSGSGAPLQLIAEGPTWLALWDLRRNRVTRRVGFAVPSVFNEPLSEDDRQRRDAIVFAATPNMSHIAAWLPGDNGRETLVAWETASGEVISDGLEQAEVASVSALAFSPDGHKLAVGTREGRVFVWHIGESRKPITFSAGTLSIDAALFLPARAHVQPDGSTSDDFRLVVGGAGGGLSQWDLRDVPRLLVQYTGSIWDVSALAVNRDGTLLASGGRDVRLWDAASGRLVIELMGSVSVSGLAFSADDRWLAIANRGAFGPGSLIVCELEDGQGMRTLRGLSRHVARIAFSPGGKYVAAVSQDWHVGIWEAANSRLRLMFHAQAGVSADNVGLAFSSDEGQFAFSAGPQASLWDVAAARQIHSWRLPGDELADSVAVGPDGLFLARGGVPRKKLLIFRELRLDEHEPTPIKEIRHSGRRVSDAAISPDGRLVLFETEHKNAQGQTEAIVLSVFEMGTGERRWSERFVCSAPGCPRLAPSGDVFSLGTASGISLLRFADGKAIENWDRLPAAIGPAAKRLVTTGVSIAGLSAECYLWDKGGDEPLVKLGMRERISAPPQFATDGRYIACGLVDGTVVICDTRRMLTRLAHEGFSR